MIGGYCGTPSRNLLGIDWEMLRRFCDKGSTGVGGALGGPFEQGVADDGDRSIRSDLAQVEREIEGQGIIEIGVKMSLHVSMTGLVNVGHGRRGAVEVVHAGAFGELAHAVLQVGDKADPKHIFKIATDGRAVSAAPNDNGATQFAQPMQCEGCGGVRCRNFFGPRVFRIRVVFTGKGNDSSFVGFGNSEVFDQRVDKWGVDADPTLSGASVVEAIEVVAKPSGEFPTVEARLSRQRNGRSGRLAVGGPGFGASNAQKALQPFAGGCRMGLGPNGAGSNYSLFIKPESAFLN